MGARKPSFSVFQGIFFFGSPGCLLFITQVMANVSWKRVISLVIALLASSEANVPGFGASFNNLPRELQNSKLYFSIITILLFHNNY